MHGIIEPRAVLVIIIGYLYAKLIVGMAALGVRAALVTSPARRAERP
jgi:hypothetical protein